MADYTIVPTHDEEESDVKMKSNHEDKSSTTTAAKSSVPVGDARQQRAEWNSGISSCLGKNDEFFSSDLEVCVMGCCAPCVLHGANVERLGSSPASFTTNCLPYDGLYFVGNCLFGWNCLAPWFSYPNRTPTRQKFNLEGSCETIGRSIGCSDDIRMDETHLEDCESACDLATHVICHPCSLCQEAREVRRRVPHPGFTAKPVIVILPPGGRTMGR